MEALFPSRDPPDWSQVQAIYLVCLMPRGVAEEPLRRAPAFSYKHRTKAQLLAVGINPSGYLLAFARNVASN
jgi:hypothetical protein